MELNFEKAAGKTKRSRVEKDEDQAVIGSKMESLPREIIQDIVSRLPISSLVQFRFVCRTWHKLAQDPDLVDMHTSGMAENSNPCLIFHCDNPIRNNLYFVELPASSCNENKEKLKKFQVPFWSAMSEFDVVGSCNGLLCLSDSLFNDALYIYNPFTRNYIELPESVQHPNQEVVFGFGFHPKTKEYKVVKIAYYKNANGGYRRAYKIGNLQSDVQIFTLGSSAWRSIGKVAYHLFQWPSQVLVNGRLHWVTWPRRYRSGRNIISFDLEDEQFREVLKPDCYNFNRFNYHLVVLGGCLSAAVCCSYGKLEIWEMKDYDVKESWIRKFNIGNYVPKGLKKDGDLSNLSKISKIASKGKSVRVLCLLKDGKILLEYKSKALFLYDTNSGKFKDLKFQGMPNWFQTTAHVGSLNWIDTPVAI